jgi:hypothetical protein
MHNATSRGGTATALGVIALGLLFTACRPKSPETPPAPVPPAPEVAAPGAPGAAAVAPPAEPAMVDASLPAPATSAPAPASRPAAAPAPDLATMKRAVSESAKLGAPVDLHYLVDGTAQPGSPVTVHLAAVPRVDGASLSVSIKDTAGLTANVAPLVQQKASAGTAYRLQMAVTRAPDGPSELRVLVTVESPEGSAFSWFGVPLAP